MKFLKKVKEYTVESKTKIAKVGVVSLDFTCPCGGQIPSPSGSLNWERGQTFSASGECNECGEVVQIPIEKVKKLLKNF